MKTLCIIIFGFLFCSSSFGQMDTIPTNFYGVAENESYTYISTNAGLYILERDGNNVFGNIYNVQDSLGLLHIHKNYLISGKDERLKIFNISFPTIPQIISDTLLSHPVSEFEDFYHHFVIRFYLGNGEDKFLLAGIYDDKLQIKFNSDSANPSLSNFRRGSDFYYPYAFLSFDWLSDTLWVYRYDLVQNNFNRIYMFFVFQQYFGGAAAYNDLLYRAESYIDLYGEKQFIQWKYSIDTTTNTFSLLNTWYIFGTGPDDINSFTILSLSQTPWAAKKYDFTSYNFNMPQGYGNKYVLTDTNLYWAQMYIAQGPQSLYYTRRVTADSLIMELINFIPTKVYETGTEIREYNLLQNFPNPFNPSTKIKYQIPELSFATLKIYDVLGNEIKTIVNEEIPAGSYEIEFNGSELTSGIYFYRLQAGNYVETKKMILLK